MKIRQFLAMVPLLAACLTGCRTSTEDPFHVRTEELFGTYVTVKIHSDGTDDPDSALDAAFAKARELEQMLSPSVEGSELNAVNASAFSQDVEVSEEFEYLLEEALYYTELTEGAFDCTIGGLIDLWGIGTEHAAVPENAELAALLHPSGDSLVSVGEEGTVHFSDERVQLHFGAIAKGYIADQMKEVLESYGVTSGTLALGGNVLTIGTKSGTELWTIGITDPFVPSQVTAVVQTEDASVVTSGNYERYFEEEGVRYHHIFNPETGYPAESGLVSTTIIAESSLTCDALSTATYVLGPEKGMDLIEKLDGVEAVFITEDGQFLLSSGMVEYSFEQVNE